jgi:hypothetical protein
VVQKSLAPDYTERRQSRAGQGIPHLHLKCYPDLNHAHSLTHRVIAGADHALSEDPWQQAYTSLLVNWATEMVLGAR